MPENLSRAERRRLEREVSRARPVPGAGLGWRLTTVGREQYAAGVPLARCRKYPVREPPPRTLGELEAESDAARARMGIP